MLAEREMTTVGVDARISRMARMSFLFAPRCLLRLVFQVCCVVSRREVAFRRIELVSVLRPSR